MLPKTTKSQISQTRKQGIKSVSDGVRKTDYFNLTHIFCQQFLGQRLSRKWHPGYVVEEKIRRDFETDQ